MVDRRVPAEQLFERRAQRRTRERRERRLNPLYLRFALYDPDRWLTRLLPLSHALFSRTALIVWCVLIAAGGIAVVLGGSSLWATLGAASFPSSRLALLMVLVYPPLKLLHELGHALAIKRCGGQVHEIGFVLMVLVPLPYVDASATAALADKRQRMLIAGAGILVELAFAEANGMIDRLSSLVLDTTLAQIALWEIMGLDDLRVSVNVSPMQLHAESLVIDTLAALEQAGVAGRKLEIELTETSVIDRPEAARLALVELRAAGIAISLDDVGTGYTSLALPANLPLDTVKIDRSFIAAMIDGEQDRAVVASIISMAHALKLRVVAEGVETEEELELLSGFGCDEVQGYLINRPQPAEDITALLVRQRASERADRRA